MIPEASTFKLSLCAFPGDVCRLYSSAKNILFIELAETQRQNSYLKQMFKNMLSLLKDYKTPNSLTWQTSNLFLLAFRRG